MWRCPRRKVTKHWTRSTAIAHRRRRSRAKVTANGMALRGSVAGLAVRVGRVRGADRGEACPVRAVARAEARRARVVGRAEAGPAPEADRVEAGQAHAAVTAAAEAGLTAEGAAITAEGAAITE